MNFKENPGSFNFSIVSHVMSIANGKDHYCWDYKLVDRIAGNFK